MIKEEETKQTPQQRKEEEIKIPWYEKIPFSVKAILFKYWFIGLDYFLFAMGLSTWLGDSYSPLLQIVILGLAMGFFNDFMLYNIYGAFESSRGEAVWYEIFKNKKIYSLLINLAYGVVWAFATAFLSAYFASLIQNGLFQEAFSWALVGLVVDAVFLFLKDVPLYFVYRRRGEEVYL